MSQRLSKPFWPPALASQAPPAIILAVLRRFRGPALFRGLRPCPRRGAPFWPSGLTLRTRILRAAYLGLQGLLPKSQTLSPGSMPFCVELDNLKDTDAPIHQPAAMLVAAD